MSLFKKYYFAYVVTYVAGAAIHSNVVMDKHPVLFATDCNNMKYKPVIVNYHRISKKEYDYYQSKKQQPAHGQE